VPQGYVGYIRRDKPWRSKGNPMKLLFVLAVSPLALVMADAAEQDTVNRCHDPSRISANARESNSKRRRCSSRFGETSFLAAPVKPADAYADRCAEYYKKGHR